MYIYNVISEKNVEPGTKSLHSSYKKFLSISPFVNVEGKTKFCISCSNTATQEIIFTADGATILEKYCDSCAKKNLI